MDPTVRSSSGRACSSHGNHSWRQVNSNNVAVVVGQIPCDMARAAADISDHACPNKFHERVQYGAI
jgi:hypothetical protein